MRMLCDICTGDSKNEFEALVTKAQEYKALYSDPATKATAPKVRLALNSLV